MSDDDKIVDDVSRPNQGVTLPDGIGAIYNIGLSPLFFGRSAYLDLFGRYIVGFGNTSILWSSTTQLSYATYYYQIYTDTVRPSYAWDGDRAYSFSLRCLVSTNNRIIMNLVSDVVASDNSSNQGITLPGSKDATSNAGLSPLYFVRSGTPDIWNRAIGERGQAQGYSARTSFSAAGSYYFYFWLYGAQPSGSYDVARVAIRPLRCLVSTNNI